MNKIGIIQGRLSPRPYPLIQHFPENTWKQEFVYAREIGYDFIEWIFEEDNFEENPIWTTEGRKQIKEQILKTGVTVDSVCADFFLENPFFRRKNYSLETHIEKFKKLIQYTAEIGAKVILLPVLENAEIHNKTEAEILIKAMKQCIDILEDCNVDVGFETELEATQYYRLAECVGSKRVGIYYDTGNCASKGYDMKKDMEVLKPLLIQVHVKDRLVGGGSVFLGTGDVNFKEGVPYLQDNGFQGSYVLQTYFEDDYLDTAKQNLDYMRKLVR